MKKFDVIVIGGGPGGCKSAGILKKAGKSVALIEKYEDWIGGTCLNEGCIPTKQYLDTSSYMQKKDYVQKCGLHVENMSLDIKTLKQQKDSLIAQLKSGLSAKLKGIEIFFATASFINENTINVNGEQMQAEKFIIATGSTHRPHPNLSIDKKFILSSKEIFDLEKVPKKILIVGGGAIGCEFATFFHSVGTNVTIAEFTPTLVPNEDKDVATTLEREFKKRGIDVYVNANITKHTIIDNENIEVCFATPKKEIVDTYDFILVSIGRIPNIVDLNLENAKVHVEKGFITTNEYLQTSNSNIYAIGDVIRTPALAHMAFHEAFIATNNLLSTNLHVSKQNVPFVTFCEPQVASVGKNEKMLQNEAINYRVVKNFYKTSAKAKIMGDDSGFIKLLVDTKTDVILGGVMIGHEATEMIHEVLIAIEEETTLQEISNMIFAHPTLSESLWDTSFL
jgi:dihydrolipoamide dehydrogenase